MYHIAGQCFLVCRSYKSRAGRLFVNTTLSTTYENQPCFAPMFLRGQSRVHSTIQLIINNLPNTFLLVICMSSGKTSSGHTVIPHKPLSYQLCQAQSNTAYQTYYTGQYRHSITTTNKIRQHTALHS